MIEAKELRKGSYILYNKEILQVIRTERVAFGTHSHSKTKVFVRGLLGGGEKSINFAHHDLLESLDIIKKVGQVVSKANYKVQIMDMKSYETFDAEVEPELFNEVNEGDSIIFVQYKGITRVLEKAR